MTMSSDQPDDQSVNPEDSDLINQFLVHKMPQSLLISEVVLWQLLVVRM
jgi:hypothetical protein